MISPGSKFKILDRGFDKTILLLPGWAADCGIFSAMDLDYNYLMPRGPLSLSLTFADMKLGKISILGWSMGGFMACDIANKYPDHIYEVIFIGIRKRYDKAGIEKIKELLKKNKRAYLYKFYGDIFSEYEKDGLSWFKRNLMKDYIDKMGLDILIEGLDYLASAEIKSLPGGVKAAFIHGSLDKIAPIEEAREVSARFPLASFISIDGAGHAPFLRKDFDSHCEGRIFGPKQSRFQ